MSETTKIATPEAQQEKNGKKGRPKKKAYFREWRWPALLAWVPCNLHWKQLKPVIRSAVAAWIAFLFLVIPQVQGILGQGSFFVVVVALLTPPSDPYTIVMFRTLYYIILVMSAWAISVVAGRIAAAARDPLRTEQIYRDFVASGFDCVGTTAYCQQQAAYQGVFIETVPSIVFAVFLAAGTFLFIWLKAHYIPLVFGTVFAMICLIVSCSYGPLYPTFTPTIGMVFTTPMLIQMGVNILCSIVILPESVNNKYLHGLITIVGSIEKEISAQLEQLSAPIDDWEEFEYAAEFKVTAQNGLRGLMPIEHYLDREVCYGRLSGTDLRRLKDIIRQLIPRISGFSVFRNLMLFKDRQLDSATASRPASPLNTPHRSPHHSPSSSRPASRRSSMFASPSVLSLPAHEYEAVDEAKAKKERHHSLFHEALHKQYKPVGTLEMEFYMNLESRHQLWEKEQARVVVSLLQEASEDLLNNATTSLKMVVSWMEMISRDRIFNAVTGRKISGPTQTDLESKLAALMAAQTAFREDKRLKILEPYRNQMLVGDKHPPFRSLFRSFLFEFHLIETCYAVRDLLLEVSKLEAKRPQRRWWLPSFRQLRERFFNHEQSADDDDDEAADDISGLPQNIDMDVGVRDPEALPPRHVGHLAGRALRKFVLLLRRGDVFFCIKAAVLVVLIDLPSFLRPSASFMYYNRGIWAVIMATLTLAQHTGDTVFGFVVRAVGTVIGCVVGIILWYISTGSGNGNPYGLCAVMAVALPFILFIRIYYLWISPMPAAFFVVSIALVVGYSWQDTSPVNVSVNVGSGWEVAWRRCITVLAGVAAAFVFNFIPTPHTARTHIRAIFGKTIMTLGEMHCSLSNYARKRRRQVGRNLQLEDSIVAVRGKLRKAEARMGVVQFEQIQGRWPVEVYKDLLHVQLELLELMASLNTLLSRIDPVWIKPFLDRMGWSDRHYMADQLAVIYMSATALRMGMPLPFLSPTPLVGRFYDKSRAWGLRVVVNDRGSKLPQELTFETLQSIDYMHFAYVEDEWKY